MSNIITKIKKGEFSKKLTVWILSIYALLVFTMIGLITFVNIDLGTNFIGILGIVTPIILINVGFYFNKSKAENLLKIQNSATSTEITDNTNSENVSAG